VSICDDVIDIGVESTRFRTGDDDGLLRSYLVMVRRVRDQRRTATITLRREDIEAIAEHLGTTAEAVLGRMADLMGSTRTQRAAMLTLFATGAMLIAATGSVAAGSPRSTSPPFNAAPPPTAAVTTVLQEVSEVSAVPAIGSPSVGIGDALDGDRPVGSSTARVESFLADTIHEIDPAEVDQAIRAAEQRLTTRSDETIEIDQPAPPENDSEETGVIIGDDDEPVLVAVGTPPVPPTQLTPETSPEPTQAVGAALTRQPDKPEAEPSGEAETSVEATESSESPEVGVTDDGATVAVGLPPVPTVPTSAG
jgi:hypothetical protein